MSQQAANPAGNQEHDEVNDLLEGAYIEKESFYEIALEDDDLCQLCKVQRPPFSWADRIIEEFEDFYIVECATKKGHRTRNMAVAREHGRVPKDGELKARMKHQLVKRSFGRMKEDEGWLYGSMDTIDTHYHLVFADTLSDDLERVGSHEVYVRRGEGYELASSEVEEGDLLL